MDVVTLPLLMDSPAVVTETFEGIPNDE